MVSEKHTPPALLHCYLLLAYARITPSFDEPPHVTSETNIFFKITEKKIKKNTKNERVVSPFHYF